MVVLIVVELVGSTAKIMEKAGHHGSGKEGKVSCTIRNIEIDDPFWTYCSNHPHHNPDKIEIPISPVYIDNNGYREIWKNIDDTEKIRLELLKLLDSIPRKTYFGISSRKFIG